MLHKSYMKMRSPPCASQTFKHPLFSMPRQYINNEPTAFVTLYQTYTKQSLCSHHLRSYVNKAIVDGYCLGCRYDDVASGAPFYSSAGGPYETGRVYLLYQTSQVRHRGGRPVCPLPNLTDKTQGEGGLYETGRVYVLYQTSQVRHRGREACMSSTKPHR